MKSSHLGESPVTAVPDDPLNSAVWVLPEPGAQLLEVHGWGVPDRDAAVRHQAVDRLLLAAQSCLHILMSFSSKGLK